MRQKEQLWWVTATVVSLAAFSFFAGLGLRGLIKSLSGGEGGVAGLSRYPQVASAGGKVLGPDVAPPALYASVLQKLKLYYVEPTPSDTILSYGSIDGMLADLKDPNTRLISKPEMDALQNEAAGYYPGLGAVMTIRRYTGRKDEAGDSNEKAPPVGVKTITVVSVAPGGPAEKAGVQPGDRITELDGRWISPAHISYRLLTQLTDPLGPQDGRPLEADEKPEKPMPAAERAKLQKETDEARARWKGSTDLPAAMQDLVRDSGEHTLTIERGTPSQPRTVKIAMGNTHADTFSSRALGAGQGYVKILAFNDGVPKEAAKAFDEFEKSGVKNLVVDLRECAGGDIDDAVAFGGMLLGETKFAIVRERDSSRRLVERGVFTKSGGSHFRPQSVSVLVDAGTSGTAELLAAALRDHLAAKLVGTKTFGDGSQQDVIKLENGAGISITRARMMTSKGIDFEGKGLQPDVAPQGDPLDAAVKALTGKA